MSGIKFVTSPENVEIVDTPFELTDGVEIDGGVLKTIGNSHSFEDSFATLNTVNFPLNLNAYVSGGKLQFTQGSGSGLSKRYIAFQRSTVDDFLGTTIEILEIDPSLSFFIGVCNNLTDFSPGMLFRDNNSISLLFYHNARLLANYTHGGNPFDIKCIIGGDGITSIYLRNTGDAWEFFIDVQLKAFNLPNVFYIQQLADNSPLTVGAVNIYSYPTEATATLPETEAYSVQSPATLASLDGVLPNIVTAGNGGEARLYYQYKDDEYSEWKSFEGVIGEWSDVGIIDGNFMPITNCKPLKNGYVLPKIVYTGSGLVSYPTIDKFTYYWSSDVTAPDAPVITTAIATNESILTILFAQLLADMYAVIYEVNINGAGSLPFSTRGKVESGYDYMRFVGNQTDVQKEAEINSLLSSINGLQEGDVVIITAFARDRSGNLSAGTQTAITMSGAQYVTVPVENYKVVWNENQDWNVRWQ